MALTLAQQVLKVGWDAYNEAQQGSTGSPLLGFTSFITNLQY